MLGPAKLAVILIAFFLLVMLVRPLAVFMYELSRNPDLIRIDTYASKPRNGKVNLTVRLYYNGSVPLRKLTVSIGNHTLYFGTVRRGVYIGVLTLSMGDLRGFSGSFKLRFTVSGIYPISLSVEESRP